MEEIKKEIKAEMPKVCDILKKYITPRDSIYLFTRIKEEEEEIKKQEELLKKKFGRKKILSSSKPSYLWNTPENIIDRSRNYIKHYYNEIAKGDFRGCGRSEIDHQISRYLNTPCVVAAIIENLMGAFIIRGKTKSFAFVVQKDNFWIGGFNYKVGKLTDKEFFELFENLKETSINKECFKIYNQELYEQIKKEMICRNIV